MSSNLPDGVEKYGESPLFNENTVPAKFTSNHATKAGVWGKICVSAGTLRYMVNEEGNEPQTLSANQYGIIKPEQSHFVEMIGPVEFKVEFYR